MPTTLVSPLVHSPDEYDIAALPDSVTVQKIEAIQQQLKALLGNTIWVSPPQVLHSTLMEIICNAEYTGLSRKEHFLQWYDKYDQTAAKTIAEFAPINATFHELYASPAAIILTAADPKPFNAIRAALLASAPLPAQTKKPPEITHCTIARYNEAVDLNEVRSLLGQVTVNFTMQISEFKLMKDLGPDFNPTVIQTYSLAKAA